ncbi:MAG: hypothetical protein AB2A00_40715 [Myxococcota bacterium]
MAHRYFRVRIRLLRTEDGGRQTPIGRKHLFHCDIGATWRGMPVFHDAHVILDGRSGLGPGDEGTARLEPLNPELWKEVQVGRTFNLHEGRAQRGVGEILEIVDE